MGAERKGHGDHEGGEEGRHRGQLQVRGRHRQVGSGGVLRAKALRTRALKAGTLQVDSLQAGASRAGARQHATTVTIASAYVPVKPGVPARLDTGFRLAVGPGPTPDGSCIVDLGGGARI